MDWLKDKLTEMNQLLFDDESPSSSHPSPVAEIDRKSVV